MNSRERGKCISVICREPVLRYRSLFSTEPARPVLPDMGGGMLPSRRGKGTMGIRATVGADAAMHECMCNRETQHQGKERKR